MTLDDLSKHQQWLKPHLEAKAKKSAKAEAKADELDVESIVERKIAEKEDLREFKSLKGDLNSMKLKGPQKAELEAEFKESRLKCDILPIDAIQKREMQRRTFIL